MNVIIRLTLLFLMWVPSAREPLTEYWMVSDESKIIISGATNVNTFECILAQYRLDEELITDENERGYLFSKGKVSLEIQQFDCGNVVMNKDFHSTLNAKEFPTITLNLSEIFLKTEINGFGIFEIGISGEKKKDVIIDLEVYKSINGLYLSGKKRFHMTDFGISPPSRLFGMIQVDDVIEIDFTLVMNKMIS